MNPGRKPFLNPVLTLALAAVLGTAAHLVAESVDPSPEGPSHDADARVPVAVLPLGLTEKTAERYPQLADRNVGFGIHDMLVDRLYDTGRFRLVEEKQEVIDDLLNRQWIAASGGVSKESAVSYGKLLGARYVLYGEVYDFSSQPVSKKVVETRIALQVRLVDVETSEYVPASGSGAETRKGKVFVRADRVEFARSTVGLATGAALEEAVGKLMQRFSGGS